MSANGSGADTPMRQIVLIGISGVGKSRSARSSPRASAGR